MRTEARHGHCRIDREGLIKPPYHYVIIWTFRSHLFGPSDGGNKPGNAKRSRANVPGDSLQAVRNFYAGVPLCEFRACQGLI
eukprot:6631895-Pyramimonas_sp.AAC.1